MDDLLANTDLLDAELPDARFVDRSYLRWLYEENPRGPAIQRSVDRDGRRVAHYAIVPQEYRDADGPVSTAFSLNAVVRSGHQRERHFTRIGLDIYAEGAERGMDFVIGVSNEKSVGAVVKYMGWRLVGPLPVLVVHPFRRADRGVTHHRVSPEFLTSATFGRVADQLDGHPADGLTNRYTESELRWRLARPHADYRIHIGTDLVAISTKTSYQGVPAAVVLKLLPRPDGRLRLPLDGNPMIGAIQRHHRAPFAVYAGFNAAVRVSGLRPPRRLQPSPLYLIIRSFRDSINQDALGLDTFEFLDMDAY